MVAIQYGWMTQSKPHFAPHQRAITPQPNRQHAEVARRIIERTDESSIEDVIGPEPELTFTVVHADLTKYPEFQLEGRLRHYAQEYLFEREPDLRRAFKIEMEKTESELRRRRMYRLAEAERVFEL